MKLQHLLECEHFALGSTAVTIMWIYSPFINKTEQLLMQNFCLPWQLTENKLSWRNEMSLDTDYAHNDIHLGFVLEFECKIVKQYWCFSVTPWQSALQFLIFYTVNETTQNYLFGFFLTKWQYLVLLLIDDRIWKVISSTFLTPYGKIGLLCLYSVKHSASVQL